MRLSRRAVALGAISALLAVGADARALLDERAVEPAVAARSAEMAPRATARRDSLIVVA